MEIVKRGIDAFNRRDVDAFAEVTSIDLELSTALARTVEGGSYRGREGIDTYFADLRDTWDEVRILGDEFRDLGDRVLVLGRLEGRGKGSGVPVKASWGMISEFRDGKTSRIRTYLDHDEALRAAGLSE